MQNPCWKQRICREISGSVMLHNAVAPLVSPVKRQVLLARNLEGVHALFSREVQCYRLVVLTLCLLQKNRSLTGNSSFHVTDTLSLWILHCCTTSVKQLQYHGRDSFVNTILILTVEWTEDVYRQGNVTHLSGRLLGKNARGRNQSGELGSWIIVP